MEHPHPLPKFRFRRRFATAASASLLLVVAIFALFWHIPFRVEGDVAYAAKSAQQYVEGTAGFNRIRLVDPNDLTADVETWLFWWPPGITAAFVLLLNAGLSLSGAARLLMLGAALCGVAGWAWVSAAILHNRVSLLLAIVPGLYYVVHSAMFGSFTTGDPLVFAVMPWLFALVFHTAQALEAQRDHSCRALGVTSVLLGSIYWLKFSAMFGAVALWLYLAVVAVTSLRWLTALRWLTHAVLLFSLPVVTLWTINHAIGEDPFQVVRIAGKPHENLTLSAFQSLSSVLLPVGPGVERIFGRNVDDFAAYLPGLALLVVLVLRVWSQVSARLGVLTILLIAVPISGLCYLTARTGYHFILDANRHAAPYWVFLQIILIALIAGERPTSRAQGRNNRNWSLATVGLACYCGLFATYIPYANIKNAWRIPSSASSVATGLRVSTLSETNPEEIVQAVRQIANEDDVVIPATYWLGQETWLVLSGRLLPLTHFWHPLIRSHGPAGADYFADSKLQTSGPVRVVLVAADPYRRKDFGQSVDRIKARFVQARQWTLARSFPDHRVQIWTADLLVTPVMEGELLRENLPFGRDDILQYVTDFLQLAHAADERYTVRDGINVSRFAMKLLGLDGADLTLREALQTAILETLGEEAMQYARAL